MRASYQRVHRLSGGSFREAALIVRVVMSIILVTTTAVSMADTPLEPDEYVVFHHHDALGNTVVTTGANGEVLWFEQTEPYGKTLGRRNVRGSGLAVDPFHEEEGRSRPGYTGHVRDGATGLTYMQARHYSPELGRFLSNDPIGVNLSSPQSFNRYAYANNNPYRYVDPDGQSAEGTNGENDSDNDGIPDSVDRSDEDSIVFDITPKLSTGDRIEVQAIPAAGPGGGKSSSSGSAEKLKKQLTSDEQVGQLKEGVGTATHGAGTGIPLKQAERLASKHGGKPEDYQKISSGKAVVGGQHIETHAYRDISTGAIFEVKTIVNPQIGGIQ